MPLLFDGVFKHSLSTGLKGFFGKREGERSALISQPYTAYKKNKIKKKLQKRQSSQT